MASRDFRNRPSSKKTVTPPRKGRGLLAGLFAGLVGGMILAGGLYWYLFTQPDGFKIVEGAPDIVAPPRSISVPEPEPTPTEPAQAPESKPPQNPEYSFYDILPGKSAPKPATPSKPKMQYWLQVAALKSAEEADRLKAKLTLLNLNISIQQVQNDGVTLHRVRVGPFKSEDEGLNALDTLAVNDFEPRWVKEPVTQ